MHGGGQDVRDTFTTFEPLLTKLEHDRSPPSGRSDLHIALTRDVEVPNGIALNLSKVKERVSLDPFKVLLA